MLSLALSVAFYNLHQTIAKLEDKPLMVIVGSLKYTGNMET